MLGAVGKKDSYRLTCGFGNVLGAVSQESQNSFLSPFDPRIATVPKPRVEHDESNDGGAATDSTSGAETCDVDRCQKDDQQQGNDWYQQTIFNMNIQEVAINTIEQIANFRGPGSLAGIWNAIP